MTACSCLFRFRRKLVVRDSHARRTIRIAGSFLGCDYGASTVFASPKIIL